MPLQQSNIYHPQNQPGEQDLFYQLIAMAPTGSFVPLPVNNHSTINNGFGIQTVPSSYTENFLTGFQDQTIFNNGVNNNNNINDQLQTNFLTNLAAFNQTVPGNVYHHHGVSHYSSESSIIIPDSLINAYGQHCISPEIIPNHPSPSSGVSESSLQNTVPPSHQSPVNTMPMRPSPPSIPGGPDYIQASEDFRACFRRVDSDDNGFITLEELRAFLENKDKSSFNDDTVLTIMDMFDISKYK
jgi:hypothetical protein